MKHEALEGIRILDFTMTGAGPYATTLLAMMGAEVIRVESRTYQDFMRVPGREARFYEINANKLGITLNLRKPEAVNIAKRLAKISHVVADAYRPGVMEKLGLDYPELKKVKNDIIAASLSGFGQTGPERRFASFAAIFSAMSGLAYITGYRDGVPTEIRLSGDLRNGNMFAFSILAAIYYWKRTGKGQYIDYSSREGLSSLMGDVILDYFMNGRIQKGSGNRNPNMSPHNVYPCKNNTYISIAIESDEEWKAFCNASGLNELIDDPLFSDSYARYENQDKLDSIIEKWTACHEPYELMHALQKSGVAAVPVFNSRDIHLDPHLEERKAFTELDLPKIGKWRVLQAPWNFSATPATVKSPGPKIGQHNRRVFGELLGMTMEDIDRLEKEGIAY